MPLSVNKFIFVSSIVFMALGIVCLFMKNNLVYKTLFAIAQVAEFLHISVGYSLIVLGVMIVYGCIKYKY